MKKRLAPVLLSLLSCSLSACAFQVSTIYFDHVDSFPEVGELGWDSEETDTSVKNHGSALDDDRENRSGTTNFQLFTFNNLEAQVEKEKDSVSNLFCGGAKNLSKFIKEKMGDNPNAMLFSTGDNYGNYFYKQDFSSKAKYYIEYKDADSEIVDIEMCIDQDGKYVQSISKDVSRFYVKYVKSKNILYYGSNGSSADLNAITQFSCTSDLIVKVTVDDKDKITDIERENLSLFDHNIVDEDFTSLNIDASTFGELDLFSGFNHIDFDTDVCANLYSRETNSHAFNVCPQYRIIEKGLIKIGVIGAMDSSLNLSLSASVRDSYYLSNHLNIVKDLSNDLRINKKCDVIIFLFHGSYENSKHVELSTISDITKKPYVDAGILGHTGEIESNDLNKDAGVPWIQACKRGALLGHISLNVTVDGADAYVTCSSYTTKEYNDLLNFGFGDSPSSIYSIE